MMVRAGGKRRTIAMLTVIMLVILIAAAVWQKNQLEALYLMATKDPAALASEIESIYQKRADVLQEYDDITVRDLTLEEEEALITGKMSFGDVETLVYQDIEKKKTEKEAKNQSDAADDPAALKSTKQTESEIVNRCLGQLYSLKGSYLGQLGALVSQAKSEYKALPQDKRTSAAKHSIMASKISVGYGLEAECDAQVEAILAQMQSELNAVGGNTAIIASIRSTYASEKAAKKAYYLSQL